jgi:predicted PurR-regulated permease PerM
MRSESPYARPGTGSGGMGDAPGGSPVSVRWARLWSAAESRSIPLRTIVAAAAVVAATYLSGQLLYRLRGILILLAVAGFIALILNPLVVMLQRRVTPRRGVAVTVAAVSALLVFAGLVAVCGYPLATAILHLANRLPAYAASAERGNGWLGHLLRRHHVQAWVQHNAPALMNAARGLAMPALAAGKSAVSLAADLVTVCALALFLLIEGPKLRAGILARMPPERAARCVEVAGEVRRAVAGYVLGDLLTSAIAGTVIFITLLTAGVPFAPLWGVWAGLFDFLPVIGGALAGIPTTLFAVSHSVTAGIVTLAAFIIYPQIENHVLNPLVMSRTVRISPLLALVSVLAGYSIGSWIGGLFGGFAGGLLGIPTAGAIHILGRQVWRDILRQREAGMTEIDQGGQRDSAVDGRLAAPYNQAGTARPVT